MNRAFLGFAVAAICVAGSASAATTHATLRLLSTQPVAVRGLHFQARERVRVALLGPEREMRVVRATANGSFRVAFADATDDRCSAFVVRAVGARGSQAVLKVNPECPPA